MAHLRLRFDSDDDGTGKLLAQVAAGAFAGEGGAWFSIQQIEQFADAIAAYPLTDKPRPELAGGFWERDGSGQLAQELLGISVYPIDHRGHIGVQVRIADALSPDIRREKLRRVQLEITTTYEPLRRFSRDLLALIRGNVTEALLEGEQA
jgi:hypothetical protein